MLKEWVKPEKPEAEELESALEAARARLMGLQTRIKEQKVPIFVLLEGWGAAGKGSVLGRVIKNIDPRFFNVAVMDKPTKDDLRRPFLYRYFVKIPMAGKFMFLDGGWMSEVTDGLLRGDLDRENYEKRLETVNCFERQLVDNGYVVLKFFFHIGKKVQRRRLEGLLADKNTEWRVSGGDLWQNKHYKRCKGVYDEYLDATEKTYAPWHIIHAKNQKWAELQFLTAMINAIEERLENGVPAAPIPENVFPMEPTPRLSEVYLGRTMTEEEYREELERCQSRLRELHNELYRRKIPVIIAYEGQDAAGKGGNIKRIAAALDPRGYEVHPIASPEPHEKARHYLWRFFTRLPRTGHIAIFDRTWYGRVMVERIEGFCGENDWQRAYNEINEFEKELHDWGAVIIKFWVQIDKDVQLARFNERQNTPEKQWKITDEDWRNREKWDAYEKAVDEMFEKTSTVFAPWHILESNDKRYARIKALKIVIDEIEKACRQAREGRKE